MFCLMKPLINMKNDRYSCLVLRLSVLTDPLIFLRKFQMYLKIQRNFQKKLDGENTFPGKETSCEYNSIEKY